MYVTRATTKTGRCWPLTAPRRVTGIISLSPRLERCGWAPWVQAHDRRYRASPTPACASHFQVDFNQFLSFLMNTSFTACAHGGGVDPAPKAFEALAAGSIPIIASSALDAAYRDAPRTQAITLFPAQTGSRHSFVTSNINETRRYRKLPVVVIDSWDDPNVLTDDKLRKWREQLAPVFERRAEFEWRLTVGFWLGQSLLGTSATAADNEKAADWWIDARAARRRPLAILHVGPYKMASSSLQAAIASFAGTLQKDGFDTPGLASGTQRLAAAAAHLRCKGNYEHGAQNETEPTLTSSLSCGDAEAKHGWGGLVHALVTARHAGRSIVLSAEDFGLPQTNIEMLASSLHDFDVKVVVMYQPLFEWMASLHVQNAWRELPGARNSGQGLRHLLQCVVDYKNDDEHYSPCRELDVMDLSEVAERYTPLVDWLTEGAVEKFLPAHTPAVLGRYALFSSVYMQTLATNSDPNELLVHFFCNGWTPQTCAVVSERAQRDESIFIEKEGGYDGEVLRALEMAVEGMRAGWLPESFPAIEATRLFMNLVREMGFEPPLRCLGVHERDVLFRGTISAEQWLSSSEMFASRTYVPDVQEIREAFTCAIVARTAEF